MERNSAEATNLLTDPAEEPASSSSALDQPLTRIVALDPNFPTPAPLAQLAQLPPGGHAFLTSLLRSQVLSPEDALEFLNTLRGPRSRYTDGETLGNDLVKARFLTDYQLAQALRGKSSDLVFGNHRILDQLGQGSMGEVFLAEHLYLKRRVAIKVMRVDENCSEQVLQRFFSEMRVMASLSHPNIVPAFDAGRVASPHANTPSILYLVLEYVAGGDLHRYVQKHGRVGIAQACRWTCQAAQGLQEAHDQHLIHRDIKPSNLLLTRHGEVKLADFGLVHQFTSQLTAPKAILGTVEFMAPEQGCDPSLVGSQADIYGLAATLFYLLTGEPPFPKAKSVRAALDQLQQTRPRRLRSLLPSAPPELDVELDRMLAPDPLRRPALALTMANALLPFTEASFSL